MCCIKKINSQQSALAIECRTHKANELTVISCQSSLVITFVVVLAVFIALVGKPVSAGDFMVPVKFIAEMIVDEENIRLNYPSMVFFDPVMDEVYLINGGTHRVVVYGPDFFPRISIGRGRGLLSPVGGDVMSNGEVFITQVPTRRNPSSRITVLNGAFFVDREIFLEQIPETAELIPENLAITRNGTIYLTAVNHRGVLVLDNNGNFLRRIEPMDQVPARIIAQEEIKKEKQSREEVSVSEESEEISPEEDIYADIPEEFRPRSRDQDDEFAYGDVEAPVKINNITIDKAGNLYLISDETGKIYVYSPDESFLFSFGEKGGSPGQLSRPIDLAVDENRELIYVTDYSRHTILTYDMTGKYLFEFGGRGYGPGWFNYPNGMAINNHGQIIVADLFNRRVQVLELGGISSYLDSSTIEPPLEETNDDAELIEQDELAPEQSDGVDEQKNAPETFLEQPDDATGEEFIIEKEIIVEEKFINTPETFLEQPDDILAEEFINTPGTFLEQPDDVIEEKFINTPETFQEQTDDILGDEIIIEEDIIIEE